MPKRWIVLMTAVVLVVVAVRVWGGGIDDVDSPYFDGSFLVDRTGTHRGAIFSDGTLAVRALDGSVSHISSALHVAGIVNTRQHVGGGMRAWRVSSCGITAATAVVTATERRDLILSNLGDGPSNAQHTTIYLGLGATGHVALTAINGLPLLVHLVTSSTAAVQGTFAMAVPPLVLRDYAGPVSCVTNVGAAHLGVLEILR